MAVSGAICDALVALPSTASHRSLEVQKMSEYKHSFLPISANSDKGCSLFCNGKLATGLYKNKSSGFLVRASDHSGKNPVPIAPLFLESLVGQKLTKILQADPNLFFAAVDQELLSLRDERDELDKLFPPSLAGVDPIRRIIERNEKARRRYVVDIMYCLIVHRFVEKNISMFSVGNVAFWPLQDDKLRSVHSEGLQDKIVDHLFTVIHDQLHGPILTNIEISIIDLGLIYVDSIVYGYVLRTVEHRFQLERASLKLPDSSTWDKDTLIEYLAEEPCYKDLSSYVKHVDEETLTSYAESISNEAMSLVERQMQALFALPDIRLADVGKKKLQTKNDEVVSVTPLGLRLLVLEALAFGSFLWDAEYYVNSKYYRDNS